MPCHEGDISKILQSKLRNLKSQRIQLRKIGCTTPGPPSVAMGLGQCGAGLLRGASCTGPEAGLERRMQESTCLIARWRPDSRRRRQLGAVRGWSSMWAAEEAARAPDPR